MPGALRAPTGPSRCPSPTHRAHHLPKGPYTTQAAQQTRTTSTNTARHQKKKGGKFCFCALIHSFAIQKLEGGSSNFQHTGSLASLWKINFILSCHAGWERARRSFECLRP